jgi:ATP-dependent DNA helicase RecQ
MKKNTANYAHTNSNFVIQNLKEDVVDHPVVPLLYVLKNILQRGAPTMMSRFLQGHLGKLHALDGFQDRFPLISPEPPKWLGTIKGDEANRYFPAREFLEKIIPDEFGDYAFVQSLILPEVAIEEIVGEQAKAFTHQQVDFYLPQARLVIEIDGQQHKLDAVVAAGDKERDEFLLGKGIRTIRITTTELQDRHYKAKVSAILGHLASCEERLAPYREYWNKNKAGSISALEMNTKLGPTAIVRFQIFLIELLLNGSLKLEESWKLNIVLHEKIGHFMTMAIEDLQIWIGKLWRLRFKTDLTWPEYDLWISGALPDDNSRTGIVNVDFSLFERYTDANTAHSEVVFVRTDYFDDADRNYFKVSCAAPINYDIKKDDEEVLEFFLQNIFDKDNFRDGQFPVLSNALNLRDTIGLLPTGGGKSLCYQLPCLLQPSVNFVVCPIKSLMKDQADNLEKLWITNVAYISSDLTKEDRWKAEIDFGVGCYLFVWISPERLQIQEFRDKVAGLQAQASIAYAVIDEVHCLSEWGHSFRTSYLNLAKTIDKLSPKDASGEGRTKFIGLTATASVNVLKDIKVEFSRQKGQLQDENIKSLLDYSRKELVFHVEDDNGQKGEKMRDILQGLKGSAGLTVKDEKAALIFTPHVNGAYGCYELSSRVNLWFPGKCDWYAGDIPTKKEYDSKGYPTGNTVPIMSEDELKKHKDRVQQEFKANKFPMMVATKAFGMGIDKSNIHYTFHFGLPSSVEALYQEAGRAGRWDKRLPENRERMATCYVLYSKESADPGIVDSIFKMETSFAEMKAINDKVGWDGRDIFRQLFLFIQGQNDIEEELEITLKVFRRYFRAGETVQIFYNDARNELGINSETLQKAIYRLSLLGVVIDWSTDFINLYEVSFANPDSEGIIRSVANYIQKYEPSRDVAKEIRGEKQGPILAHATRYLLKWIFENITYNRKQSLKTLVDFCNDFRDSDSFKRRLDNYFKFTEWTFILQHISEAPSAYETWFDVLTIIIRGLQNEELSRIYLPEIQNETERKERFEALRDAISRFLESYRSNPGLNMLSGLSRLFLNEYENTDGKERLEDSIRQIKADFEATAQDAILDRLVAIGKNLGIDRRTDLCRSISLHFPERFESIAIELDLLHLLKEIVEEKVKSLKSLNQQLYEYIAKI